MTTKIKPQKNYFFVVQIKIKANNLLKVNNFKKNQQKELMKFQSIDSIDCDY